MSISELTLRTATKHVKNFEEETVVMRDHYEAMECLDCETYLDLGIDAFTWISRATKAVRKVALETDHESIEAAETSLRALRKMWLGPCDMAERWAGLLTKRGFTLPNLEKFRQCCDTMRQLVACDDNRDANASRVPSAEILSEMAIEPPREWINEPAW